MEGNQQDNPRRQPTVRLSDETIAHLEEKMRDAVTEAVKQLVVELKKPDNAEAIFAAFFSAMRSQAAKKTGDVVLGGMSSAFRKAFWILMIVVALVMAGDWQSLQFAWQAYRAARTGGVGP